MTDTSNVVYIEDEPFMIDMVDQVLRISGYNFKLTGATSGAEGLALLRRQRPDVLLLDLTMPDTNGWDIYREIKQDARLADIPVIVISATIPEAGRTIVNELPPVADYITKPFNVDRLIRSVREVVERHKVVH